MEVIIVKEVLTCDVSPVVMFVTEKKEAEGLRILENVGENQPMQTLKNIQQIPQK